MIGNKITIKGQDYDVMVEELVESSFGTAQGVCNTVKKYIKIDSNLELDQLIITYLHEIGHALFDECSWNCTVSREIEEVIVDTYAKEFCKHFIDIEALKKQLEEKPKKKKKGKKGKK